MKNFPLATLPATEVRILHSTAVNQDYLISVALPFHYVERPDKTYPVIYVLDANLHFGIVVDMVRVMNYRVPFCNELPDLSKLNRFSRDALTAQWWRQHIKPELWQCSPKSRG
jgi:predicted alpha/beta superfamily hydrolase